MEPYHKSLRDTPWSNAEILLLTKLWNEGLRTGLIASRMKRSRNSIIGKIQRLRKEGIDIEERTSPIKWGMK